MKFFLVLATAFSFNAMAADYYSTTINWNAKFLEDSTVLMCDDTFYSGVEIEIPGEVKYPEDFISFEGCDAEWKITKKKIINHDGKPYTSVRLKGGSECTIHVKEKHSSDAKLFVLEISDAC